MKDKELLNQLNKLRQTRPDAVWLQSNRDLLASQLYSGSATEPALTWFVKFNLIGRKVFQPQYVAMMIAVFFFTSGLIGFKISQASSPGDSLYVAKRISERAQLMLAFSDSSKTKLNVEFANKRLQEMKDMLAKQDSDQSSDQPAKIADLKASAKAEIQVAKDRLAKTKPAPTVKSTIAIKNNIKTPVATVDNEEFIAAEATKDDQRLDISLPDLPELASTTPPRTAETVIEEAQKFLDTDNLDEATKKLDELNNLIK